jgi:hypothetical protein
MENTHTEELHWGWLVAFYLLIVVLLFIFGDVFTALVGILVQTLVFAGYYNSLHKEI